MEEGCRQRVEIASRIGGLASRLFGRHVERCPGHTALDISGGACRTPVDQHDLAIIPDQDVVRFHIAMHNAQAMCIGQRLADLDAQGDALVDRLRTTHRAAEQQ
jgi:hypothetical protein